MVTGGIYYGAQLGGGGTYLGGNGGGTIITGISTSGISPQHIQHPSNLDSIYI